MINPSHANANKEIAKAVQKTLGTGFEEYSLLRKMAIRPIISIGIEPKIKSIMENMIVIEVNSNRMSQPLKICEDPIINEPKHSIIKLM